MNIPTLFSVENITWDAVHRLYGQQAVVTGVREWYHPEKGWQKFPATSAMAMVPEHQVMLLAERGATTVQLYVDISREETRTPDFLISELYTPPCSTSSTSTAPLEQKNTRPATTSDSSKATKPPSRRASKNTGQGGAPATAAVSTTTSPEQCPATETENDN